MKFKIKLFLFFTISLILMYTYPFIKNHGLEEGHLSKLILYMNESELNVLKNPLNQRIHNVRVNVYKQNKCVIPFIFIPFDSHPSGFNSQYLQVYLE